MRRPLRCSSPTPAARSYNGDVTRRFLIVTVCLAATVAFLVGLVVAGSLSPSRAVSATRTVPVVTRKTANDAKTSRDLAAVSFADVAERLNPAVVNIDATSRGETSTRRRVLPSLPDSPDLFDAPPGRDRDVPRRGAGTGFIIDPSGLI